MTLIMMNKIISRSQREIKKLAKQNSWMWFYNLHQVEVANYAEKLLKIYKKADRPIVLISCWLHDIAHYYAHSSQEILAVKANHHLVGAEIAGKILRQYPIKATEIARIKNCILCHRNQKPYCPETLEEKIMTVADTMSHFGSIFYFTYFKFHPDHTLEKFVEDDLAKLKRDWRDIQLLPRANNLVSKEYQMIKKQLENYKKQSNG
jgi:HD superfamily phosphodiesterase